MLSLRDTVTGFRNAASLVGLEDAWYWSPAPGIDFAGGLSADGRRLLQMSARDTYGEELALAVLRFGREHEGVMFRENPHLGFMGGFTPPPGFAFDTVAATSPEVHNFYAYQMPELTPHVRVIFPAFSCEFSGTESPEEAYTRFDMIRPNNLARGPHPFLKMRYINTKTRGRSVGSDRGFAEPERLYQELRDIEGGRESIVEFENRHGRVWRVMWYDGWHLADWTTQSGEPRGIGLAELLEFSQERLTE
ncbi:hypothetical protein [Streptomyces boninensis]|uniref:hypothetical protein n=1 Tax=Streptomyces boninensis TaxID=2039455 RepID=UPI003B211A83